LGNGTETSQREKELYEARYDELIASNKVKHSGLVEGTSEYEEAYKDWVTKYWRLNKLQEKDDNIHGAEGCAQLIIYLLVIGFVFYWIIKGLFSIKYW
jgi:hypothetical protein